MLGVLALVCGNGYIVGINQIYDVDIDTVNKPFLPIAAGTGCSCKVGKLTLPGLETQHPNIVLCRGAVSRAGMGFVLSTRCGRHRADNLQFWPAHIKVIRAGIVPGHDLQVRWGRVIISYCPISRSARSLRPV